MPRRRVKHITSLEDRLVAQAQKLRAAAALASDGATRLDLERQAHTAEMSISISRWVTAPDMKLARR